MRIIYVMKRFAFVLLAALAACGRPEGPAAPPETPTVDMNVFGSFEYQERMTLPEEVLKWNGKRVKTVGFMNPGRQIRDIEEFELVKDRASCCFGRRPLLNHFFQVKLNGGEKTHYTSDPVTIEGTLKIDERWDGDWLLGLYWLDDAKVINP
ncbi:MAG: DUF3299 domain-containing protein [Planctomycetes bacterium]|nr:DUF3299 domain-containing protein [Planctomycetota bacterium]